MGRNRLILETGATRSRFVILDGENRLLNSGTSSAFNPNIHPFRDLETILRSIAINVQDHEQVIAFIAGYTEEHAEALHTIAADVFPNSKVMIHSDLESIGYILSQGQRSWIGILGTGSSFAFWNGHQLERHIPGFGYMIGDEGSGRHIASEVTKSFYRDQLSNSLKSELDAFFPHSYSSLIQLIYKDRQWPAISTALMKSLEPYWQEPELLEIARACIDEFLQKVVDPALKAILAQSFLCGGVAFAYKDYICDNWPSEVPPTIYASAFDIFDKDGK